MNSVYNCYSKSQITKGILDQIQIGDLIKINDWKQPLRVKGVSENFFVMAQDLHDIEKPLEYSVFSKIPFKGFQCNGKYRGDYFCGPDFWLFGDIDFDYKFDNPESLQKYFNKFETGESEISMRNSVAVYSIQIKKENNNEN